MANHGKSAPPPSVRRREGVVISYAYTIAQVVVNLIYVPMLLSIIGQSEYGLYQLVGSIISYVTSINSILSAGVGRYYSMYRAEQNTIMMENTLAIARRLYWALSACAFCLVCALTPVVNIAYQNTFSSAQLAECSIMLIILGLNVVVTFNNTINIAAINANERFVFLKGSQLATLLAQPLLILLFAHIFPYAITIAIIMLIMNIICALLQRIYSTNVLNIRCTFHGWDKRLIKELFMFSGAIVMVSVADQLFWNSGKLIVGYYFGPTLVAIYAVGAQIYSAYTQVGISISGVFFQRISDLYHKDRDYAEISRLFAKVGRLTFMICSLILGGFLIIGRDFVSLWAGEGFDQAYYVAIIIMIPLTVDLIQNLGLTIMQVENCYQFRGYVYLALAVCNTVASIIVAPHVGIVGIASISGIGMLLGNGLIMNLYYKLRVNLDISLFWREILQLFWPFLLSVALSYVLRICISRVTVGLPSIVLSGTGFVAIFLIMTYLLGLNDYERSTLDSLKNKLLSH